MTSAPAIDGRSRVYAIFGDPVDQVRTPALINPVFHAHGVNIVAVPFRVTAAAFDRAWDVFSATSNVAGIGVTVPHKIRGAQRCQRVTPDAAAVGAVNAVRREPDGTMYGALFDGIGFIDGLGAQRSRLRAATVLLVGAGGAGRSIAHALVRQEIAKLRIADIDSAAMERAVAMVNRDAGGTVAEVGDADLADCTVLINATTLGLKPSDRLPVLLEKLDSRTLVADIASLKGETALLAAARAKGCAVMDGNAMLQAQIGLIAGFIAGLPPGASIGAARVTSSAPGSGSW